MPPAALHDRGGEDLLPERRVDAPTVPESIFDLTPAELASRIRAEDNMGLLSVLPQEKVDATLLELARDTYGLMDTQEYQSEMERLRAVPDYSDLAPAEKALTAYDHQILSSIASDELPRIALLAEQALSSVQEDMAAKWNSRQGLNTWHNGEPPPVLPSAQKSGFSRSVSGNLGRGLNFTFMYSSALSNDVEIAYQLIAEAKLAVRAKQLAYIRSR